MINFLISLQRDLQTVLLELSLEILSFDSRHIINIKVDLRFLLQYKQLKFPGALTALSLAV